MSLLSSIEKEVSNLFAKNVWIDLSEYEKNNYCNQYTNFKKMKEMGISVATPSFMLAQQQSTTAECLKDNKRRRGRSRRYTGASDDTEDEDWKPPSPKRRSTRTCRQRCDVGSVKQSSVKIFQCPKKLTKTTIMSLSSNSSSLVSTVSLKASPSFSKLHANFNLKPSPLSLMLPGNATFKSKPITSRPKNTSMNVKKSIADCQQPKKMQSTYLSSCRSAVTSLTGAPSDFDGAITSMDAVLSVEQHEVLGYWTFVGILCPVKMGYRKRKTELLLVEGADLRLWKKHCELVSVGKSTDAYDEPCTESFRLRLAAVQSKCWNFLECPLVYSYITNTLTVAQKKIIAVNKKKRVVKSVLNKTKIKKGTCGTPVQNPNAETETDNEDVQKFDSLHKVCIEEAEEVHETHKVNSNIIASLVQPSDDTDANNSIVCSTMKQGDSKDSSCQERNGDVLNVTVLNEVPANDAVKQEFEKKRITKKDSTDTKTKNLFTLHKANKILTDNDDVNACDVTERMQNMCIDSDVIIKKDFNSGVIKCVDGQEKECKVWNINFASEVDSGKIKEAQGLIKMDVPCNNNNNACTSEVKNNYIRNKKFDIISKCKILHEAVAGNIAAGIFNSDKSKHGNIRSKVTLRKQGEQEDLVTGNISRISLDSYSYSPTLSPKHEDSADSNRKYSACDTDHDSSNALFYTQCDLNVSHILMDSLKKSTYEQGLPEVIPEAIDTFFEDLEKNLTNNSSQNLLFSKTSSQNHESLSTLICIDSEKKINIPFQPCKDAVECVFEKNINTNYLAENANVYEQSQPANGSPNRERIVKHVWSSNTGSPQCCKMPQIENNISDITEAKQEGNSKASPTQSERSQKSPVESVISASPISTPCALSENFFPDSAKEAKIISYQNDELHMQFDEYKLICDGRDSLQRAESDACFYGICNKNQQTTTNPLFYTKEIESLSCTVTNQQSVCNVSDLLPRTMRSPRLCDVSHSLKHKVAEPSLFNESNLLQKAVTKPPLCNITHPFYDSVTYLPPKEVAGPFKKTVTDQPQEILNELRPSTKIRAPHSLDTECSRLVELKQNNCNLSNHADTIENIECFQKINENDLNSMSHVNELHQISAIQPADNIDSEICNSVSKIEYIKNTITEADKSSIGLDSSTEMANNGDKTGINNGIVSVVKGSNSNDSCTSNSSVSGSTQRRYPKRNVREIHYCEYGDNTDETEAIYCEHCLTEHPGHCPYHRTVLLLDTPVPRVAADRARLSTPWPLVIVPSKVPGAGLGVITKATLPCCLVFGPYQGVIFAKTVDSQESGYGWQIRIQNDTPMCVDAADVTRCNWMRYVNCPRTREERNLSAFQYKGQIFYKTIRKIFSGNELMVWYGDDYGRELGLSPLVQPPLCNEGDAPTTNSDLNKHIFAVADCFDEYIDTKNGISPVTKIYEKENVNDSTFVEKFASAVTKRANSTNQNISRVCRLKSDLKCIRELLGTISEQYGSSSSNNNNISNNATGAATEAKSYKRCVNGIMDTSKRTISGSTKTSYDSSSCDDGKKRFKCECCEYRTAWSGNLKVHMRTHTGDLLKCESCEYRTAWSGDLKAHMRTHTGDLLKCECCEFRTARSGDLKAHMRTHTGDLLKCEFCEYRTAWSGHLKAHMRTHTGDLLKCECCEFRTARSGDLKAHMRTHTGDLLKCESCEFRTGQSGHLKAHMRTHTGDLLKCEYCEYRTARSGDLKAHMRTHTGDLLKCEYCEYRTARSGNLKAHMRTHTGDLLKCEYCEYRTAQSGNLKAHMRTHTGDLLKCEFCEFRTAWSGHLKAHIRTHTGDLLKCECCEYRTAQSGDLKAHMRTHTGDLLKCESCEFRTAHSGHLKAHMRTHTGDLLKCE